MSNFIDLSGQRFSRLLVLSKSGSDKYRNMQWACRCDCGEEVIVNGRSLRKGLTKSCGCIRSEMVSTHKLFDVWCSMKQRCYNPNSSDYKFYGNKGIKICDEWLNDFKAFYNWSMANGYTEELTIDRIDNKGNYYPENCQWLTNSENAGKDKRKKHDTSG